MDLFIDMSKINYALYAHNKRTEQPAHLRILISTFVILSFETIIS